VGTKKKFDSMKRDPLIRLKYRDLKREREVLIKKIEELAKDSKCKQILLG
jgi:hypothetical protein